MNSNERWIGWSKKTTVISLMAISLLLIGYFWTIGTAPKPVFDFDNGTTQGWILLDGYRDDTGKKHGINQPIATLAHNEREQYPNQFPCTGIGSTSTCDDLHNKKGSLVIPLDQVGVYLQYDPSAGYNFNFPTNSSYWETDVISPVLSEWFQNKTEFEAYMGDMLGAKPGHIRAKILLSVGTGSIAETLQPIGSTSEKVTAKDSWTKLSAKFNVPTSGYIKHVIIRIRGDWKNFHDYDGALFLDQVAAIK